MRQLITRIDDDLHARVKRKARDEGKSVNELVRGLLEAAVAEAEEPSRWKQRMIAAGTVVAVAPPAQVPGRPRVASLLREAGPTLTEHLDWDRENRWR